MNQQTSYSLKASILEYKNSQISNSEESVLPTKDILDIPDVAELTRIMLGVISVENTRKMTLMERQALYSIVNDLHNLTYQLN